MLLFLYSPLLSIKAMMRFYMCWQVMVVFVIARSLGMYVNLHLKEYIKCKFEANDKADL